MTSFGLVAIETLGNMGLAAVPYLTELLKNDDSKIRAAAARSLGEIGPDAKTAIPALFEAIKDNPTKPVHDCGIEIDAAKALGNLKLETKAAISIFTELQKDTHFWVRSEATFALGRMGAEAKPAAPALTKLLQDENVHVRCAAASALSRICPSALKRELPLKL